MQVVLNLADTNTFLISSYNIVPLSLQLFQGGLCPGKPKHFAPVGPEVYVSKRKKKNMKYQGHYLSMYECIFRRQNRMCWKIQNNILLR